MAQLVVPPFPVYVPVLKGKDGEFGALEVADGTTRSGLLPLIDVPPVPWDSEKEKPRRTLDQHLYGLSAASSN